MNSTTTSAVATSNPYLVALLHEYASSAGTEYVRRWSTSTPVTYCLTPGDYDQNGINDWSENGAGAALKRALAAWQSVCGITFAETTNGSQANLVERINGADGNLGTHHYPNSGNVSVGNYNESASVWNDGSNNAMGSFSYTTFIHELGHAIGLEHPHSDGGDDYFPGVSSASDTGDNGLNQQLWTVMSYNRGFDGDGGDPNSRYGWVATPMAFDIAAVQLLYGRNMTTATGNNTYTLPSANQMGTYYACIWDAGGIDTIRANPNTTAGVTINLNAATLLNAPGGGGFLSRQAGIFGGFTIANGVVIENAIGGAGNDTITGNNYDNQLTGGAGNDVLIAGAGRDTLNGGPGNDTYMLGADADSVDTIVEAANNGVDTLTSTITRSLNTSEYAAIEVLMLGGASAINVTGNALNNTLIGNAAANTLDGLGGSDTLRGLGGNDLYIVGSGDVVDESAAGSGGIDTVKTAISYTLGANVENLVLIGTAAINGVGNGLGNALSGNNAANTLNGLEGNDVIRGYRGADTLTGHAGNDRFVFAEAADSLVAARDRILDFDDSGDDTIDLSQFLGSTALTWRGTSSFNGINQVRVSQSGADVLVSLNLDSNTETIEFQILLSNTLTLSMTQSDFVL